MGGDEDEDKDKDTLPKIEIIQEAGSAVIEADAAVTLVGEERSFGFTEGPVWVPDQEMWIFTDISGNTMYKYVPGGAVSEFRKPSNFANGDFLDFDGTLLTCEQGSRAVSRTNLTTGVRTVIADLFEDKKLNSPNDVIVSQKTGMIYFTDPDYGAVAENGHGEAIVQEFNNVFMLNPTTDTIVSVLQDYVRPNGLAFNVDETKMYITDSGAFFNNSYNYSLPNHVGIFDVEADGTLSNGTIFAEVAENNGIPDGIKVDTEGNVWSVAMDGVEVFSPDGIRIVKIRTKEAVANLAFGGPDGKDLMMTSSSSVYIVRTKAKDSRGMGLNTVLI